MNKSIKTLAALALAIIITSPSVSKAEELSVILKKVEQYSTEGNVSKALEELSWAKKELEAQYLKKLAGLLPETLNGFTGEKVDSNAAMGFTTTSRVYAKDADKLKLEINGGTGGGTNAGMGGLAALGQMAAMFGGQAGQASLRINGRTATLQEDNAELTIFLNGGSMLVLRQVAGKVDLKPMAEALDMDSIEKFITGAK